MWKFAEGAIWIEDGKFNDGVVVHDTHPDVNGKWGGVETQLVSVYQEGTNRGALLLYALVGEYSEVGLWPDSEEAASRFEVIRLVSRAMRDGISPTLLKIYIEAAIEEARSNESNHSSQPV